MNYHTITCDGAITWHVTIPIPHCDLQLREQVWFENNPHLHHEYNRLNGKKIPRDTLPLEQSVPHRDHAPAVQHIGGDFMYYRLGKIHRNTGPSAYIDGDLRYYQHDRLVASDNNTTHSQLVAGTTTTKPQHIYRVNDNLIEVLSIDHGSVTVRVNHRDVTVLVLHNNVLDDLTAQNRIHLNDDGATHHDHIRVTYSNDHRYCGYENQYPCNILDNLLDCQHTDVSNTIKKRHRTVTMPQVSPCRVLAHNSHRANILAITRDSMTPCIDDSSDDDLGIVAYDRATMSERREVELMWIEKMCAAQMVEDFQVLDYHDVRGGVGDVF